MGNESAEIWLGDGTSALAVAIRASGCCGGFVATPAAVCPAVVVAIRASGNRPWFVDIEPRRLGMDAARLAEIIEGVGAVVFVHAYGVPGDVAAVAQVCRSRGITLIEDCAQAEGAVEGDRAIGCVGDYAVFSYGTGKILDVGGGGRVVTADPERARELHRAITELAAEARAPGATDRLNDAYRDAYNRHYPDRLEECRTGLSALLEALSAEAVSHCTDAQLERIRQARRGLRDEVVRRRIKARRYRERLAGHAGIELPELPEGSAPWRANVFLEPGRRDSVLRAMLGRGIRVSSWYPAIADFLLPSTYRSGTLDITRAVGARLMNLWVDSATGEDEIEETCAVIRALVAERGGDRVEASSEASTCPS